jgi:DNA-directed RNA polymerase subunit M/transcription elongation factor TFIIS
LKRINDIFIYGCVPENYEGNPLELSYTQLNPTLQVRITEQSKKKYLADMKCKKCGEFQITRTIAQLRSMDEGSTSIYNCNYCNMTWKEN